MTDIIRELRENYPAVDVTTVVFSRAFAGVGHCVIPHERVLAIAGDIEALVKVLTDSLDDKATSYAERANRARSLLERLSHPVGGVGK